MNIDIDRVLLEEARRLTGMATASAVVTEALMLIVARQKAKAGLEALAGAGWEGDLDVLRKRF